MGVCESLMVMLPGQRDDAPVVVHRCWDDAEAAVVVSFLAGHNIEALARTELPHGVFPVNVGQLAEIRIEVSPEDAPRAIELLSQVEQESVDQPEGA